MSKCTLSRTVVFNVNESGLDVNIESPVGTPCNNLTVRIHDGEDSFVFSCTPEFAAKMAQALKDAAL